MPKIVKVRNYNPPNLLEKFSSNDISPASGNDLGSADKYVYNASSDLRLWLRFESGVPVDLVNYDPNNIPTIVYEGTEETAELTVYNNRMKTAKFDNVTNQYAELTFPGGSGNNNILTFGDGATEDLPFSVSLWFRKLPESDGSDNSDYLFAKGKSDTEIEYAAWYDPSDNNLHFDLFAAGDLYDRQRISVNALEISDNNWHHIVFTYNGEGGLTASDGMQIYIDGIIQSKTPDPYGTYTYMDGVSELLYIGGIYDGGGGHFEADGNMAEFAVWAKELSLEEIKAIYNWTYEDSVVKSGYTNLPPRVRLRGIDNRPGCYPTKHRMGDKDRSGKANIFYEDLPIQFGNKIEDDFKLPPELLFGQDSDFDKTKWVVSAGLSIRKEYRQVTDGEYEIDDCAVFSGVGTSGERYIRTKSKIRNPHTVTFDLLQGPYNEGEGRLNLKRGRASYSLKLQISTDSSFSTSTTIATYVLDSSNLSFYGLATLSKKPSKTIKLGLKDFPDPEAAYYLRLVQDDYDSSVSSWAIRNIKIEYANQNIRHPLNLNYADTAGNKIARQLISLPHTSGTLSGTGRSLKGVSDVANPFQTFEEDISPFNEALVNENADIAFFNEGLDPEVYPGFSSPTRSKTKFTVDLNPSEPTSFGYNTRLPVTEGNVQFDTSKQGQRLMVYWNNNLKRWEKIGNSLHVGNAGYADLNEFLADFPHQLTSSCLGFTPSSPSHIAKGIDENNLTLEDSRFLKQSFKKTDTYCFPFGPQYFATSSFAIKARDLGITKPFLLEKTRIDFYADLNFGDAILQGELGFAHRFHDTDNANPSATTRFQNFQASFVPTFFMLRQFKDNFSYSAVEKTSTFISEVDVPISFTIPGSYDLHSASADGSPNQLTYVDKNRELITYNNIQFILRPSDTTNTLSFDDIVNSGLSADANILYEDFLASALIGGSYAYPRFSGHFSMGSNLKVSALLFNGTMHQQIARGDYNGFLQFTNKNTISNSRLKNSRNIVNGFSSYLRSDPLNVPAPLGSDPLITVTLPDEKNIENTSAYLILPDDELVFGWQYPVSRNAQGAGPGTDTDDAGLSYMTLRGSSKLHLYGSLVVENKEFHETVNQNLTSCAVYEHIIGDDKVLDQWQVAYRGEMTGSYSRQHTLGFSGFSDIHSKAIIYSDWDSPQFFSNYLVVQTDPPSFRIGASSYSNLDTFSGVIRSFPDFYQSIISSFGQTAADLIFEGYASAYKSSYTSIKFRDEDRLYADNPGSSGLSVTNYENIAYYYDNSTYGTTQKLGFTSIYGIKDIDRSRPNYSFNRDHFGHYADMFQQGRDGKFKTIPRQGFTTGFDISVNSQSPVQINFVSGTYEDNSNFKSYISKNVDAYLEEFSFQSSNLSTAATSSMPFIDDDIPHNRTYLTEEYIAVPIF